MARLGQRSDRPVRPLVVVIGGAAVLAVGTAVVVNDQPPAESVTASTSAVSASDGVFRDSFEGAGEQGAPIPKPKACPAPPAGFSRVEKTWSQLWAWGYPCSRMGLCERRQKLYPAGQSYPAPIGAEKGTYTVVPFVPVEGVVQLYWDQVQSRGDIGYSQRPADLMLGAVSRCDGDVEAKAMGPNCSLLGNAGALTWSTRGEQNACRVTAGETYYLHLMAADPTDGLTPGEHTCTGLKPSLTGCDVGARTQASR